MGYDALRRIYPTKRGFILLSATETDLSRLNAIEGMEGIDRIPISERSTFLMTAFSKASAEAWAKVMQIADLGASVCENIEDIRRINSYEPDGSAGELRGSYSFTVHQAHPCGREVTQLDPYAVRTVSSAINYLAPAEKYGASTRAILGELQYDTTRIERMIASGTISESWSSEYLPS